MSNDDRSPHLRFLGLTLMAASALWLTYWGSCALVFSMTPIGFDGRHLLYFALRIAGGVAVYVVGRKMVGDMSRM
jgi:zinc transporter ZupT